LSFLRKLFGPQDPAAQAQKLIRETEAQKAALERLLQDLSNEYNIEGRIKASEKLGELKSFGEMDVVSALTSAAKDAAVKEEEKRRILAAVHNVRPEQIGVRSHADNSRVTIAAVKTLRKLARRTDDTGRNSQAALEDIKRSFKEAERNSRFYAELGSELGSKSGF
jgi:hypothetical protein